MTEKTRVALIFAAAAVMCVVVTCIAYSSVRGNQLRREVDVAAIKAGLCQVQNAGTSGWINYHYEKCR